MPTSTHSRRPGVQAGRQFLVTVQFVDTNDVRPARLTLTTVGPRGGQRCQLSFTRRAFELGISQSVLTGLRDCPGYVWHTRLAYQRGVPPLAVAITVTDD